MADEAESAALALETANKIIENKYENDPDFPHLADTLTTARSEEELADLLIFLCTAANSLPGGISAVKHSAELFEAESENDFWQSRTGKIARSLVSRKISCAVDSLGFAIETAGTHGECEPYIPALTSDFETVSALAACLDSGASYSEFRRVLMDYAPMKLGSVKRGCGNEFTEAVKESRNEVKDTLKALKEEEFALSAEALSRAMLETSKISFELASVLEDFNSAFIDAKNKRMICDFSDLGRLTLSLLDDGNGGPSDIALEERNKYSHIFVDEYQDTSEFQDRIFNLIARTDNLFIVGDVKQSIYSFRGAQPDVFASYRNRWKLLADSSEHEPGSIYMSENFRCSQAVIDFTNYVCGRLFTEAEQDAPIGGGIGYRREDDLIYKGKSPTLAPVGIYLCEGLPKPESETDELPKNLTDGSETEIDCIVRKIYEIAKRRGCPETGRLAYEDIAVLARNSTVLSKLADRLTKEGIPFCNNAASNLFDNPEVELFYSILCSVDNPMRDVHLAGALRSPVFGFTLTDLLDARLSDRKSTLWEAIKAYPVCEDPDPLLSKKCSDAVTRLSDFRRLSEELPIDRFIRLIWKETGAIGYSGSSKSTKNQTAFDRQSNLRRLYDFARQYQTSGYRTLHDFVKYVADILENGTKVDIAPASAAGAVSLMTVHKSKGLEFPAVILAGASSRFNKRDAYNQNVFCRRDGIGFVSKLTDPTGLCVQETPMRIAVSDQLSVLSSEEEIRILYVAFTRAREELYITAHGPAEFSDNLLEKAEERRSRSLSVFQGNSWIEWIAFALAGLDPVKADGFFRINPVIPEKIDVSGKTDGNAEEQTSEENGEETAAKTDGKTDENPNGINGETIAEKPKSEEVSDNEAEKENFRIRKEAALEKMKKALSFEYGYKDEASIPAKLSVSRLYPDLLSDAENDGTTAVLDEPDDDITPSFMSDEDGTATAAEKGTATHMFLQFCDFSKLDGTDAATEREIQRLVDLKFLPARSAPLIRRFELTRFARSSFFSLLSGCTKCERERRFNIMLPASDFTSDPSLKARLKGQKVLVQGVFDLVLETVSGELILCDYKTDRIPRDLLASEDAVCDFLRSRHLSQLSYYSKAVEQLFGRSPDKILLFPLAYGEAVQIM